LPTSPEGAIRTVQIWKRFRADKRSRYLRDELGRLAERVSGRRASDRWRWALQGIDFAVDPGSSVGLVGVNGSGKTTLLKIMNQVMYPTVGRVETNGRIGALVAISAGIHPNLTGRENIMLTASFMGLSRKQAAARFDEIVAFAELEPAIDRQAKYYSMGMQARLGFGVAAFLEPAILLVDEVLAVGDAAFQQRCLDRMRHVLSQGTTLVFVSHDLAAVEATCSRTIWLSDGRIVDDGPTRDVLSSYRGSSETGGEIAVGKAGPVCIRRVSVRTPGLSTVRSNGPLEVEVELESDGTYRAWVYLGVGEGTATPIFLVNPGREMLFEADRRMTIRCEIERLPLPKGRFYLWAGVYERNCYGPELLPWQAVGQFDVYGPRLDEAPRAIVRLAPLQLVSSWSVEQSG
jgi:ABC-type polysaccharide/polyol phosphate transport system ATPase subunit